MPHGSVVRSLCLSLALAGSFLFVKTLDAQATVSGASSDNRARITGEIDESRLTRLTGHVPFVVRPEFDRGSPDGSSRLTHMRLLLRRSAGQETALERYLVELHDKSSPNYRHWLNPDQFGALYGPADSDIARVVAWLQSHGLDIEEVSKGRTDIAFSGTVAQVESAFHTSIHQFRAGDQSFTSNTSDPLIPSALTPVVGGVAHLNTIQPRPMYTRGSFGVFDSETKRLIPVASQTASGPMPALTTGSSPNYHLFITAADAATIYNSPNSFNGNFSGSTEYNGAYVTIGIGGDAVISTDTAGNYGMFVSGGFVPTVFNVDGVTSTKDKDEAYIDIELSKALAPYASIFFYTATDLLTAIERAINDNHVDIFSLSFQHCELGMTTAGNAQINALWQQAAAQGIAVTVSSGDDGSAGCDAWIDSTGKNITAAKLGQQVNGFASTPYNVAVGGTDFYGLPNAFTSYVSTTEAQLFRTALKYIPESTWNDSTTVDGMLANNVPQPSGKQNIVAGSGGASACSTNSSTSSSPGTCTSGYSKPAWQQTAGMPVDGVRDLPDISLMAGGGKDSAAWLVCTDDTFTSNGVTYTANCASTSNGFAFSGFGGTSTSAPAFAGILAVVQSRMGFRLGQAAQELYELSTGPHAGAIFHDITQGNISVPCVSGSPNCAKNAAGNFFETGYDTSAGYDFATGLGSVDATQLVSLWGSATGSTAPTINITPSATTMPATELLTVTVNVTGTGSLGTPTERISLVGGGYDSGSQVLVNGSYEFYINPGTLSVGTDKMTVTYTGDPNYAPATASIDIDVTGPSASFSPPSLTFPNTAIGSSSAPQSVVIKSVGTETLTISGIGIGVTDFQETNDCGPSLAIGAFCTITVTFTPSVQENAQATLLVNNNSANPTGEIPLSGVSYTPAPAISLNATTLNFPDTVLKTASAPLPVEVTNSGTAALNITGVSFFGFNPGEFSQTNNCGTVAPQASCTINITFTPSAYGAQDAFVSITDNVLTSPQAVELKGSGIELGTYTLSGSAVALTPGGTGSSTITANPSGGYTGTITLSSCSAMSSPTGAVDLPSCVVSTATVVVGSSPANGAVTVTSMGARAALASRRSRFSGASGKAGALLVAGVLAFCFPCGRRKRNLLLVPLLAFVGLLAISACGGGGGSGAPSDPGTTPGSYTFSVKGTDSVGVKQTCTIAVTVN